MKKVILGIFICLCSIFIMSHNTFAIELSENVNISAEYINPYWRYGNSNWTNGSVTVSTSAGITIDNVTMRSGSNSNISANVGDYYSFVGTVIATGMSSGQSNKSGFFGVSTASTDCNILDFDVDTVEATPLSGNSEQRTVRYTVTGFCRVTQAISTGPTINFYVRPTTTSTALGTFVQFHNLTKWNRDTDLSSIYSRMNELKTSLNNIETSLDDILSDLNEIKDNMSAQGEAAQKELESTESIENQDVSDTSSNVDNAQTTSIINVFGGFLSALSGVNTGSCVVNLPFPSYAGGTWQMNICQNKDKAGNIVSLFGSATMIFFFLPVAWRLLGMIYNEIRSFTNG